MTVQELLEKVTANCPPNCQDKIVVSDNRFGEAGPLANVRYKHTPKGMVLELVYQGDLETAQ